MPWHVVQSLYASPSIGCGMAAGPLAAGVPLAVGVPESAAGLWQFVQESVGNDADWALYGGMSGAAIRFLVERHGPGIPRRLLEAMGAGSRADRVGYVYALHDAGFRADLEEALAAVLGIGMEALDQEWRAWLGGAAP